MEILRNKIIWGLTVIIIVFACIFFFTGKSRAINFEEKLPHDKVCVVKAVSSEGDVYLSCKDTKGILKTTVDLPMLSSAMSMAYQGDFKKYMEFSKKSAQAQAVWGLLDFSFHTQLYVLLTFNKDKTLVEKAIAYMQPDFEEKAKKKDKIEL